MSTFTKGLLSGSTNGKQIKVSATTNGTAITVHTAVSGTSSVDEIWLYATNTSSSTVNLTVLFGGTTEPDNQTIFPVPAQSGRFLVLDGVLLQNGLAIKAYAGAANVLVLDGYVNTIGP